MHLIDKLREHTEPHVLAIADYVWSRKDQFVMWPTEGKFFSPDKDRSLKYHAYSDAEKSTFKAAGISLDARSNGPAILAYLLVGGERPIRPGNGRGWTIHHIYDGKFSLSLGTVSAHAVKGKHLFTHSAGLVAIHPVADALADEVAYFAWLLRKAAFEKFGFDPDNVFATAA